MCVFCTVGAYILHAFLRGAEPFSDITNVRPDSDKTALCKVN